MDKKDFIQYINKIKDDKDSKEILLDLLVDTLDLRRNPFHPLIFINGNPHIGDNVFIGFFSEVNAKDSKVVIGDNCDIASYVSINVADSHMKCLGISDGIERKEIILENNVFVGSHCFIGGSVHIGHHSVVASGTILVDAGNIPPYSLVVGNPPQIKEGYYSKHFKNK